MNGVLFFQWLINIGNISIKISATDDYGITKIEFYVDDELKKMAENASLEWLWDERVIGRYTIKAVAFDVIGYTAIEERNIWIFNL